MAKFLQEDFDKAQEVLELMVASIRKHEPYATVTIECIDSVLTENSFDAEDYPE